MKTAPDVIAISEGVIRYMNRNDPEYFLPPPQLIKHRPTCWEQRYPTHSIYYNPNTKVKVTTK